MRIKDFEEEIASKGVAPFEARLWRGAQVKWFLCRQGTSRLVVYDSIGRAWIANEFLFPDEVEDIKISYRSCNGDMVNIEVNGITTNRDSALDLFI